MIFYDIFNLTFIQRPAESTEPIVAPVTHPRVGWFTMFGALLRVCLHIILHWIIHCDHSALGIIRSDKLQVQWHVVFKRW